MLDTFERTIVAQCTAQGAGAIALVRISGPRALSIADAIGYFSSKKKISTVSSHTIHYGWVQHKQELIDQVLFLVMHPPKTFTGQMVVEITCHNNQHIVQRIIEATIEHGAQPAQPGEFTQQAVVSGKIDLLQAEAIHDLITAQHQHALKQSLSQLKGSFSRWTHTIENNLIKAVALCEASFEFIDEENLEFHTTVMAIIQETLTTIHQLKHTFNIQQHLKHGIRVALIGSVNAGKSSLFNALVKQERAIVTTIAGTTRDVIEASVQHNGISWTLVDTAGLRQTQDIIEQEGIKRSYAEAHKADIVLLVADSSRTLTRQEMQIYKDIASKHTHKTILVWSKIDRKKSVNTTLEHTPHVSCSATTQENINSIEARIMQHADTLFKQADAPFLLNTRQFNILLALESQLQKIAFNYRDRADYELLSYDLQSAITHLTSLTGKTISQEAMNAVFKEFCVGK